MLCDSIHCSRVDVLIRIFVLSSIDYLDDRPKNIVRLWRALGSGQTSLEQLVGRGFVIKLRDKEYVNSWVNM